ncbi:MAG: helix-turn-helix domain-containing protein [Anaerolineales bacterium]|nr:helix-turn-helix domain-containing protein [Anaerolineales bacterium]
MDAGRSSFAGRERVVNEIIQGVLAPQPQSFSLVGPKFIGKSHLLHYLSADDGPLTGEAFAAQRPRAYQDGARILVTWVDCHWQDAQQDLSGWIYENLRAHVRDRAKIPVNWSQIEAQPSASRRVWQLARELSLKGLRVVLLLDNFDRVFENQLVSPESVDELRPLTLELALLVATEQPLHDLDRELAASPLFNVMAQLFLGLLDPGAAREWVLSYAGDFPPVHELADELVQLTGMHPFLLRRLGDILVEVRQMLPSTPASGAAHLPLLRLRLAEHGRVLFETAWKRLQNLPPRLSSEMVNRLIMRMIAGPLPLADIQMEQTAALNWLINQAMVTCCNAPGANGYQLFTPLFAEFLARKFASEPDAHGATVSPPVITSALDLDQFTKIEASLLRYFQTHQNETVSTEQLLAEVWKRPGATNRRVQEAIRRLRLQLETTEPPIGIIENDRGRGYRFVPAT